MRDSMLWQFGKHMSQEPRLVNVAPRPLLTAVAARLPSGLPLSSATATPPVPLPTTVPPRPAESLATGTAFVRSLPTTSGGSVFFQSLVNTQGSGALPQLMTNPLAGAAVAQAVALAADPVHKNTLGLRCSLSSHDSFFFFFFLFFFLFLLLLLPSPIRLSATRVLAKCTLTTSRHCSRCRGR